MDITEILGNRLRLRVLTELYKSGELTVTELVQELGTNHRVLNSHLRVLEDAGLIAVKWIGRMRMVRLSEDPRVMRLVKAVIELDGRR